jgi:hypothetical protein
MQITGTTRTSGIDAGQAAFLVAQGGPIRITNANVTVGTGSTTNIYDDKGLKLLAGGDLIFDSVGNFTGFKLAGAGTSGDIITTNASIISSTNGMLAVAGGGVNVSNSTLGGSNISLVANGAINVSLNFRIPTAKIYSRSLSFQLTDLNQNQTISISESKSSLEFSRLRGTTGISKNNADIFEAEVIAQVIFPSKAPPSLPPTNAYFPPPPPQQFAINNLNSPASSPNQPQAKQAAPDGDAPAPNQAPSNQQPAANKPPPKDGAAADAPDGDTASQPKQAANDPAAPAPAPSAAPRQAANNAPAPAPAPTPQSAPANNAAPAPVAPAAPTQVSLAAPPPPVAPPPPTPVATEKPPTPKDAADSGDKTLAMAAPPPPKAAAQSQASTTRTSVVSVGLVDVQVPVPPRPPSGAAVEQPMPTLGNSARW